MRVTSKGQVTASSIPSTPWSTVRSENLDRGLGDGAVRLRIAHDRDDLARALGRPQVGLGRREQEAGRLGRGAGI